MCGIAAIFAYRDGTPPVDEAELLAVREQMVARGPDGGGQWISDDGRVGLANRRLSIIDVSSAGAQPMLRGLALPDDVLQKLYHDNAIKLLARVGTSFGGWG